MLQHFCPSCDDDYRKNNYVTNNYAAQRNYCKPAVNIYENQNMFRIDVAIPGFTKEDLKIDTENYQLIISSEKPVQKVESETVLRQEFCFSAFKRTSSLPESVAVEKISASFNNGILSVVIPKKELLKKQIVVN